MKRVSREGFTLLEVAIVVIIISGLAYLATPTGCTIGPGRAKVSRAKADMRSLATAIESYYVDHTAYPAMKPLIDTAQYPNRLRKAGGGALMTVETGRAGGLKGLTTPIAYLTSMFPDPFAAMPHWRGPRGTGAFNTYAYHMTPDNAGWILFSPGPDGDYDITAPAAVYDPSGQVPSLALLAVTYDPTNGSNSNGDVWRVKQ